MSRVLVTGAAGYLGSVLCEHLLNAGHHVMALDNAEASPASLHHLLAHPDFEFICGDARQNQALQKLLKDADALIPLAAVVGAPACERDPELAASINLEATRVLNRLRRPDQAVIFPMTTSYRANGNLLCTEDTPMEGKSLYVRLKLQAEKELLESPHAVSLRLASMFGLSPKMRWDLLAHHFIFAACTQGSVEIFEKNHIRNFVHVRDAADSFIFALKHFRAMSGRPYHVGLASGNISKWELALKIQAHVPRFEIRTGCASGQDLDQRNAALSYERLGQAGFVACRSLEEGIGELVEAFHILRPRGDCGSFGPSFV